MNETANPGSTAPSAPRSPAAIIAETVAAIGPLDQRVVERAWEREESLTKPPGSLGLLEEVGVRLAAIAGAVPPPVPTPAALAIFCGDHGVQARKLSPWPQAVTMQMAANVVNGGAVSNVLARGIDADLVLVDVGALDDMPDAPLVLHRKVRHGTADFVDGPAMTRAECEEAVAVGIEVAHLMVGRGAKLLVPGDLGIGNTTASAALVAAFTGRPPAQVTGRGAGSDDAALARKVTAVEAGLARAGKLTDPLEMLADVGGLEHCAAAGFLLAAAALRVPAVLDGVIALSAALAAAALAPDAPAYWFSGHHSAEPGCLAATEKLGLRPLLDLGMRLGEGTGALAAVPLVQNAARILAETATFDGAGVSGRED